MKITAMTYNICSGMNMARQRDLKFASSVINQVKPDFVTLNEVSSFIWGVPHNQALEMGRLTGYYPVFGKAVEINGGDYGNGFLSHHPVVEQEVIPIPDRKSDEKTYFETRAVLRCVVDIGGKLITVLSTHFGLARVEAQSAVETVLKILETEKNPVLLQGDLNLRPHDEILKPIFAAMHDTAEGKEEIMTFSSEKPDRKIDYIFHSDGIRTLKLYSVDTLCSDHLPLIAELEID